MTSTSLIGTAAALVLGVIALAPLPATAAPETLTARPLVLVASGGWASRVEGDRGTYDARYGNGYYGDPREYQMDPNGFGSPRDAYEAEPYGYGNEDEYGAY